MEDYQGEGMRSLKEYYRFLLREDGESEAPPEALFGQYAFAPTRDDVPEPKEPNTPKEAEALRAIERYISNNVKTGLTSNAETLLKLHQQGFYKKILSPENYSQAFRFLVLTPEALAKILHKEVVSLGVEGVTEAGMLVPHESVVSGWTVTPDIFKENLPIFGGGQAIAIFRAQIAKNKFFGNPGEMAVAVGDPELSPEMETIAVGPVSYNACSYVIFNNQSQNKEAAVSAALDKLR